MHAVRGGGRRWWVVARGGRGTHVTGDLDVGEGRRAEEGGDEGGGLHGGEERCGKVGGWGRRVWVFFLAEQNRAKTHG
jgi:hypothetical protein